MTDTVSCQNCDTELPAGAAFCTSCGTRVGAEATSGTSASTPEPSTVAADDANDATRVDTPGLLDATQVLPSASSPQTSPPMSPPTSPQMDSTQVIAGSSPPAWTPPPPPPQAPWQPPSTDTPQPGAWQPPPPPQPDWAQSAPPTAGQGWAAPTTPSAPPSQWQQPQGPWSPGGPTPIATPSTGSGAGKPRTTAGAAAALTFVGAILLVVGVFGLWLQSTKGASVKLTGWEMVTKKDKAGPLSTPDPAILLGIAAAAIAVGGLLVAGTGKALMRVLVLLAGVGAAVVLARDYLSIKDAVKHNFSTGATIDFKYGFWVAAAGALILIGAAVVPSRKHA